MFDPGGSKVIDYIDYAVIGEKFCDPLFLGFMLIVSLTVYWTLCTK